MKIFLCAIIMLSVQKKEKGGLLAEKNLNENIETLDLAPKQFSLPEYYH